MRHIQHPGPAQAERTQCVAGTAHIMELDLPAGVPLLAAITQALAPLQADSAVLELHDGACEPFAYVLPAMSETPAHAVYYSQRYQAPAGSTRLQAGCITYGRREGSPWLHCHAIWTEADGAEHCGHVLPDETVLAAPLRVTATLLRGMRFEVAPDAETNFSLFQPRAAAAAAGGMSEGDNTGGNTSNAAVMAPSASASIPGTMVAAAYALQIRPNEDFCTALEALCEQRGIRRAALRGGVGSLIGATFDDGRTVQPIATELFIEHGVVEPGPDGRPCATVDVTLVDYTGATSRGRLRRGANPVLVTFELVVQPLE
jgi:predicted DNA-binding protein with PD1-like motif